MDMDKGGMKGKKINLARNRGEMENVGKMPDYPQIHLEGKQADSFMKKKVGDKVKMKMTGRISSQSKGMNGMNMVGMDMMDMEC